MAKIELSDEMKISFVRNIGGTVGNVLGYNREAGFLTGGSYANSYIRIMKGSMPANIIDINSFEYRRADILIEYMNDFSEVKTNENPIIYSATYKNAITSGDASWFYLVTNGFGGCHPRFMGSIGVIGSNSDLEIKNVSVIEGNPYKINNLQLKFPTDWIY